MHNGGLNDGVIDTGGTETMRPVCEQAHRFRAVIYHVWYNYSRDGTEIN